MKLDNASISFSRPQILDIAANRVEEWSAHSWKWLTKLRSAVLVRVANQKRSSTRTMRCDQRKAIAQLLQVMIHYLDLKTMQVGFVHSESQTFVHLSLEFLSKKANLPMRRAQRAMSWLYQSGYISGLRQFHYDPETQEYQHKPSARRVNPRLLIDLGITEHALLNARKRSKNRQRKQMMENLIMPISKPLIPILHIDNLQMQLTKQIIQKSQKERPPPETYLAKLKKLISLFPNLSIDEVKSMLPPPSTYTL